MAADPADPFVGLIYHWIGGLAAASFYIPFKLVRRWSWETYWLVGGVFAWIVAPLLIASLLVPNLWHDLAQSPFKSVCEAFIWGLVWGVGGLMYGLTMRYLGIALGVAIALGLCTAFGTLMPPLFAGQLGHIASEPSGRVILIGIGICLVGITLSGLAGMSKERELDDANKKASVEEFQFWKGLFVAVVAGVMSAAFAFGLSAGQPIADVTRRSLVQAGHSELWQNLPVLICVMLGGFTTNFFWCIGLNIKNRSGNEYIRLKHKDIAEIDSLEAMVPFNPDSIEADTSPAAVTVVRTPTVGTARRAFLITNYALSAAAGVIWYLQFFFYSMGQTRMGKDYGFSSWTLHMASIIIFSTLWGVALKELKGTSIRTKALVALGLAVLVSSTVIIGYGNYLKASHPTHHPAPPAKVTNA